MVEGVADGFAQVAFGQDGPAHGELVEEFFEAAVNRAAVRGAGGFAQGEFHRVALGLMTGQLHEFGEHVFGDFDGHFHGRGVV